MLDNDDDNEEPKEEEGRRRKDPHLNSNSIQYDTEQKTMHRKQKTENKVPVALFATPVCGISLVY